MTKRRGDAHYKVKKEIVSGRLIPPYQRKCVDCGKQAQCYDHRDYRKPLDVDPVCRSCDRKRGIGAPYNITAITGARRKKSTEKTAESTNEIATAVATWDSMDKLRNYLNGLDYAERKIFCEQVGTTERFLRKACSIGQRLGAKSCVNIERASKRTVTCEDLRPDVEWKYLRQTSRRKK